VNVTIVGAGVVGCAIACELASRGVSVCVIDPRGIGKGATQASAGILAPGIEAHSPGMGRLLMCSLGLYDAFVARIQADAALPIEYERGGTLQVALDATDSAELAATAGRLSESDVRHTWLTASDAARFEPGLSRRVEAALLVGDHGYVAVTRLLKGLGTIASKRGVTFVTTRVATVHDTSFGARVVTADQAIESDAAVVAAGSWSSDLAAARIRPAPIRPIRGQLVRLRASSRTASRVIWGSRCYVVPWRDGPVLVGATSEDVGFDERATAGAVHQLLGAAVELLPALERATFEEVRVGLRPMALDELPVIGRASAMPHVFYATGHYRNGVLLAPLTASLIADLVVDNRDREELSLTRPARLGL
jgi:glycine oxidase